MAIENTSKTAQENPLLTFAQMLDGSSGIERQEAIGQKQLVHSTQLPTKHNDREKDARIIYQKLGFVFKDNGKGELMSTSQDDDIFVDVELPEGWKKEATDHSMWSNLLDHKGRKRASIFYKAAFYDREAFINFMKKINFRVDRLGFLNGDYSQDQDHNYTAKNTPWVGRVTDFDGTVLFETKGIKCNEAFNQPNKQGGYTDKYKKQLEKAEQKLNAQCLEFLQANYPDYNDFYAYW